jgi:CII-binding regulator of phage lambda lysogenization HflD
MEKILKEILNKLEVIGKDICDLKEGQEALKTELKNDIKDLSAMVKISNTRFDTIEAKLDEQGLIVNRLSSTVSVNSSVSRNLQERIEYLEEHVS